MNHYWTRPLIGKLPSSICQVEFPTLNYTTPAVAFRWFSPSSVSPLEHTSCCSRPSTSTGAGQIVIPRCILCSAWVDYRHASSYHWVLLVWEIADVLFPYACYEWVCRPFRSHSCSAVHALTCVSISQIVQGYLLLSFARFL